METRKIMSKLGWCISNTGYEYLSENATTMNITSMVAKALDIDIRDFGESVINSLQNQNRTEKIILQIQKIRNVASPKSKEDSQFAPRMLKLVLTDGHTTCQAIEVCNIPFISRSHTPPGSKLLINGALVASGYILLEPRCCELLGGRVPALCERWELVKNISQNLRSAGADGPPPWVNFGGKIITPTSNEPFKALASKVTTETTNEFDLHRQDAISNATTGAVKKIFGGVKQPVSFNNPIKQFHNQEHKPRGSRGSKRKGEANDKAETSQKPQEKVSLFDFLENKLTPNQTDDKQCIPNKYSEKDSTHNIVKQIQHTINVSSEHSLKPITKNNPYNVKSTKNSFISNQSSTKITTAKNPPVPTDSRNPINNQNNEMLINELSNNLTKISFDTQFAARSLKQNLNSFSNGQSNDTYNNSNTTSYNWKVGDMCMAKYWEDGKYYNAVVINLTQKTCVVSFNDYGNVEEVLKVDCLPLDVDRPLPSNIPNNSYRRENKGSREHPGNKRPYLKKSVNGGNFYYKS